MQRFPRATLSTKAVTVSMYITPVASSCTIQVVDIVATVDSTITLVDLVFQRGLNGGQRGCTLIRQAATSLKPGGGATPGLGMGDPHNDIELDSSSMALLHSLAHWCWTFLPLNPGCSDATSTCPELEGSTQWGLLAMWDAVPLSSQGSHYVELSSFLPSHTA